MGKGDAIIIGVFAAVLSAILAIIATQHFVETVPQRAACEAAGNVWVGQMRRGAAMNPVTKRQLDRRAQHARESQEERDARNAARRLYRRNFTARRAAKREAVDILQHFAKGDA